MPINHCPQCLDCPQFLTLDSGQSKCPQSTVPYKGRGRTDTRTQRTLRAQATPRRGLQAFNVPPVSPQRKGKPASTQGGPAWQDMGSQSVRNGRNLFGYLDANPQGPTPFNR